MNISGGIPTNAIGSIAVDPNDPTGKTIYVGTGEANASGDSEAGLGLYKTTDGGDHWSLVPGSFAAVANLRSIALESRSSRATRATSCSAPARARGAWPRTAARVAAPGPATGVYNSTDGGASFAHTPQRARSTRSSSTRVDPNIVVRGARGSASGGCSARRPAARRLDADLPGEPRPLSFAAVTLPNGKTRDLPVRRQRRSHRRAGLSRRRREPARGDADRVEQRRLDAALEPDGRHAGSAVYN